MKSKQRTVDLNTAIAFVTCVSIIVTLQCAIAGDSPKSSTNSIGMKFVTVPPGEFLMGTTRAEAERLAALSRKLNWKPFWPDRFRSETPHRKVTISSGFELGVHEVTVAQFRAFVDATKYKTEAELEEKTHGTWRQPMKSVEPVDTHPVEQAILGAVAN